MDLSKVTPGDNPPEEINVIIEVPLGGDPIKYEIDKFSGAMFVDLFLYTSMRYPTNYGFIPHTLSGDGDPVDVLCVGRRPLIPGCVLRVRPIGVLLMEDNSGEDEKILAVPTQKLTGYYDKVHEYTDLPDIQVQQIEHFFAHYKDLEPGKWVKINGWRDAATAKQMILAGLERAKQAEF